MDWWTRSCPSCLSSTGSVDWGDRRSGLYNGAGQCGSQNEPSYSKHRPKVPRLHCHPRWLLQLMLNYSIHFLCCCHFVKLLSFLLFSCRWLGGYNNVFILRLQRQDCCDGEENEVLYKQRWDFPCYFMSSCNNKHLFRWIHIFPSSVPQWLCLNEFTQQYK